MHNSLPCFQNFKSLWSASINYRKRVIANGNEVCGVTAQSTENLLNVQFSFNALIFQAINKATLGQTHHACVLHNDFISARGADLTSNDEVADETEIVHVKETSGYVVFLMCLPGRAEEFIITHT